MTFSTLVHLDSWIWTKWTAFLGYWPTGHRIFCNAFWNPIIASHKTCRNFWPQIKISWQIYLAQDWDRLKISGLTYSNVQPNKFFLLSGYPHPDDQPARICVQSRLRQPRAVVATVPAPLQPSPPRVGVASSSCPSPSVAKPSDSPTSSSRWQHQNSWESVNEGTYLLT